ncbi:hypothetical protein GN958_ATG20382, partial [Phytophthora infestans]
ENTRKRSTSHAARDVQLAGKPASFTKRTVVLISKEISHVRLLLKLYYVLCKKREVPSADLRILPGRVGSNVSDEMIAQYDQRSRFRLLPKTECIRIIKRCRNETTGANPHHLEQEFLQVNLSYSIKGKFCRLVGLEHPDLIRLMKYRGNSLFIDATYTVIPKMFTQTLIVMIYDNTHDLYNPCS